MMVLFGEVLMGKNYRELSRRRSSIGQQALFPYELVARSLSATVILLARRAACWDELRAQLGATTIRKQ